MLKKMVNAVTGTSRPQGPRPAALAPSKSGSTQNMSANVKVVVRVRPLNEKEMQQNNQIVVDVVDDKMLVFDPKEEMRPFFYHGIQHPNKNYLKRANKELKFVFDNVCGQSATNREVFETTTKDILASLMEGYNCSVFAYGATGAGKTFTMIGNEDHPGITYLTMDHLFHTFNSFEKDREFDIGVSYIEVYNENVYDLLKPSNTPLQLREDTKYGVTVAGLTLHKINTAAELLDMLENGNKNRTQHPTDSNAESSRSHAVFQVYVKMRYKTSSQLRVVKLSMIDLAGSERASATGCVGERFKEGANINKSLLSLGNCINKLADGGSYIPYRDSKLTRLLKDSLGGNCKTVMIANISPSATSYDDTYNTLKYAARANKIQLSIKKNIVDGNMRASQYIKMNEELKKKVIELEAKLSLSTSRPAKELDSPDEKLKQQWYRLIYDVEATHATLEGNLLSLMVKQRVLALRHLLRTEAFAYVANLAHRSSTEALEEFCTENFPRRERSTENYLKQSIHLEAKIKVAWTKWDESRNKYQKLLNQALAECADLKYFVKFIELQRELRLSKANAHLNQKLFSIEKKGRNTFKNCMSDMPCMLKKLYLTLKGYNLAPPALTDEYLEIMKKSKLDPNITWYDKGDESDGQYKCITTLDFEKPTATLDFNVETLKPNVPIDSENLNTTIDLTTDDSDDMANVENRDPLQSTAKKTPIKLANNETVLINNSFELLDTMANRNHVKKLKMVHDTEMNVENYGAVDPNNLNSTFVLAGKMEALQKPIKMEFNGPVKRELADRTNTLHRTLNFNDKAGVNIVKPVIGKAMPVRRMPPPSRPAPGFGSSLSRDGTPLQRTTQDAGRVRNGNNQSSVGYKTVKMRDRVRTHPYNRPVPCRRQ